jgi:catechol 2,3-dioxygenase-like lactoylglutathione lyase family enzyme
MKEIRNCDYIVLLCNNMSETRTFYKEVMGFAVELDYDGWASFRVGSTLLALRPRGPAPAWDDGPSLPGSAAVQLAFRVPPSALAPCHAELLAKGVPVIQGPTDLPAFRHRTVFFRDPEGNVVEIYAEY